MPVYKHMTAVDERLAMSSTRSNGTLEKPRARMKAFKSQYGQGRQDTTSAWRLI